MIDQPLAGVLRILAGLAQGRLEHVRADQSGLFEQGGPLRDVGGLSLGGGHDRSPFLIPNPQGLHQRALGVLETQPTP